MPQLILFNKPYGILTQFSGADENQTLAAYIKNPGFYPAGRLDKNSEGLLLLTNNGSLQHQLSHPKYDKKKYYWVQVEGQVKAIDLEVFKKGLKLQDECFLPAEAKLINEPTLWPRVPPIRIRQTIPTSWIELILREGKNHQVRRMTAAIGFPTLRLVRHRIGQWDINSLQPGEYKLIDLGPLF